MPHALLLPLCVLTLVAAATGQTGRTMRLNAPAVIGQTALFAMQHPVAAAGNLYLLVWSPPFASAVPLSVPGLTVNGLVRVDLANAISATSGVLVSSGITADFPVPIPNDPLLVGYPWDLQGVDLSATNVLTLAADDLSIVVSAPPLPAANMVAIPPGTFQMGSPVIFQTAARPVHQVTITRPLWMSQHEVTQAEYQAVMGGNPSHFQGSSYPNSANRPVEQVTWYNAVAYCAALTVREAAAQRLPSGYQYRLPTEAEWEYCCRAGTTTEFHYGPTLVCGQSHFGYSNCGIASTALVGSYAPNAWGLLDMHGNVWEWCLDGWDGDAAYQSAAVVDPFVSGSGAPFRIVRGGSWDLNTDYCRSGFRGAGDPGGLFNSRFGFRVVLAPVRTP